MKRPDWTPTTSVAVVSFVIGAVWVVLWFVTEGGLREWAPHIAAAALTIAVTVTVVDKAVQREAVRRLQPRVESVMYRIGWNFRILLIAIAVDYAKTHADTFEEIPADGIDMINLWLSRHETEDVVRTPILEGDDLSRAIFPFEAYVPALTRSSQDFAEMLEGVRERDREVLEPPLIRAIDDYLAAVGSERLLIDLVESGSLPFFRIPNSLPAVVRSVREFAVVFQRYGPGWVALGQEARDTAREISERARSGDDQPTNP
jgi:hypothetical protein